MRKSICHLWYARKTRRGTRSVLTVHMPHPLQQSARTATSTSTNQSVSVQAEMVNEGVLADEAMEEDRDGNEEDEDEDDEAEEDDDEEEDEEEEEEESERSLISMED